MAYFIRHLLIFTAFYFLSAIKYACVFQYVDKSELHVFVRTEETIDTQL